MANRDLYKVGLYFTGSIDIEVLAESELAAIEAAVGVVYTNEEASDALFDNLDHVDSEVELVARGADSGGEGEGEDEDEDVAPRQQPRPRPRSIV